MATAPIWKGATRVFVVKPNVLRYSARHLTQCYRRVLACHSIGSRCYSAETSQQVPPAEGECLNLEYSEKVKMIADSITTLTLLEVASLNQLLKVKLNIQDMPMMPMGGMPVGAPAAAEEETQEAVAEKTEFNVKLVKFDDKTKVKLIKEIKAIMTDMNLVQAKKFVESVPQLLRENVPKEEAEKIKKSIEDVGGSVEIE